MIIIDGDACPVKKEVIKLASKYNQQVLIVASFDHYTTEVYPAHVKASYVERGNDAADYKVMSLAKAGDCLITQDYGLASLALAHDVAVFHHSGKQYHKETIDFLLMQRYHHQQQRQAGQRTKGPKKFTRQDREHFCEQFENYLKRGIT